MFTKLWKGTISIVMSLCLSVCIEELCSHWMDFHEILKSSIFRKSFKKIKVSLMSDKSYGFFT